MFNIWLHFRVTIDTLQQLVDSKLSFGGWGEINREFFKTSLDSASQTIGSRFEMINNSGTAVDRVANGKFAFYENAYFLEEAAVQRQLRSKGSRSILDTNGTQISSQVCEVGPIKCGKIGGKCGNQLTTQVLTIIFCHHNWRSNEGTSIRHPQIRKENTLLGKKQPGHLKIC